MTHRAAETVLVICNHSRHTLRRLLVVCLLPLTLSSMAAAQQLSASAVAPPNLPEAPGFPSLPSVSLARQTAAAGISGTVTDPTGAPVSDANVTLDGDPHQPSHTAVTDAAGRFHLLGLPPGAFKLSIDAPGLEPWTTSGVLHRDESVNLPDILLRLEATGTSMDVQASISEISAAQVSLEEKQRVLGFFPNFYAVYVWDAAPLTSRQKFSMAWRQMIDPVTFGAVGFVSAFQQSQNDFKGYGQGTKGYSKRYAAGYTDGFTSTMLGQAILPSLLHQDPRYFVKGTGTIRSRAFYAIASTVICKDDRGRWKPNYSNVLGNVASAGISNLYYPASSRQGGSLTVENSLIGTAGGAFGTLMQEFVLRRMTPNVPDYAAK